MPARRGRVKNRVLSNCVMICAASCTSPVTLLMNPSTPEASVAVREADAGIDGHESLHLVVQAQPRIIGLLKVDAVEDGAELVIPPADGDHVVEDSPLGADGLGDRTVELELGRVRQSPPIDGPEHGFVRRDIRLETEVLDGQR